MLWMWSWWWTCVSHNNNNEWNNSCSSGYGWRLPVHLGPQRFYDIGGRPAGPWWQCRALLVHERLSHSAMHESNSRGADGVMFVWKSQSDLGNCPNSRADDQIETFAYWEKLALVKGECEWEQNVFLLCDNVLRLNSSWSSLLKQTESPLPAPLIRGQAES